MKLRKADDWEDMPKVLLFRWRGKRILLVNWEDIVIQQADGSPVAGMDMRLWWRVFSYL